jgi:hypothetical protein
LAAQQHRPTSLSRAQDGFCFSFSSPDLSNTARETHAFLRGIHAFPKSAIAFSLKIAAARLVLEIIRP